MGSLGFSTALVPMPDMPEAGTLHLRGRVTYDEVPELRKFVFSEPCALR